MAKKTSSAPSAKKAATKAASTKKPKASPASDSPQTTDTQTAEATPIVPTLGLNARMEYPGKLAQAQAMAEAYQKGTPITTDQEYDSLVQEIRAMEKADPSLVAPASPTQRVMGDAPKADQTKVTHLYPMLSLDNAFTADDIRVFCNRVATLPLPLFHGGLYIEPKVDGIAIDLMYENGVFKRAATRGDGAVGEDVTAQALTIRNLPKTLEGEHQGITHVRGEVHITLADFATINAERAAAGDEPLANPRNAAAGAMNCKDIFEVREKRLSVVCYDLPGREEFLRTSVVMLQTMKNWGLPTLIDHVIHVFANNQQLLESSLQSLNEKRSTLPFAIDGAVIKLVNLAGRQELGFSTSVPRWAVAFKYPPEEVETTVTSVTIQVGRRGTLTPVAEVIPVHVSGSTVSRASLSNWDKIARLGVQIGDRVMLCKGGEIIPDVVRVLTDKRNGAERPVPVPTACPFCGSPVSKNGDEDAVAWICTGGQACPEIQKRCLEHACSKEALDIRGVGPYVVEKIYDALQGATLVELLSVTKEQLTEDNLFSSLQADKILTAIQTAIAKGDQARLLYALSIPFVGASASRALITNFGGLRAAMMAPSEQIRSCPDLLAIPAQSFDLWRENPETIELLEQLEKLGFVTAAKERTVLSDKLADQVWVITGTLSQTREHFEDMIRQHGGKVGSDVSKKTAGLLVGDKAGGKIAKAKKHDVKVYTEADFLALIAG